jgi:DNA-binding MarR family transcriptional regulator
VPRFVLSGKTDQTDASVLVNGADATVTNGDWTCTLDLVEGRNDLLIVAVDGAGNRVQLPRTIILDTVAPVIEILEPLDGSATNKVPVTVRGTVDSPLLAGVVTVNGEQIAMTGGLFALTMPASADGPLEVTVVGLDLAGNVGRAVVTVIIDRVPPSVTGLSIVDGQLTNDPHILMSGDVEAGAVLHVGPELVDYVGSSFTIELDLAEGANAVSIEAVDAVGNLWNRTITVRLDTVPPQLVVDGILDGRITFHGDGFTLTGRTEMGATVLIFVANVSTPVTVDAAGEFTLEMTLQSGETTIQVHAQDPAGNGRTEDIVAMRAVLAPAPKWTESPLVRGGSAVGAILIVLCVAAALEPSRYALLLLILPLYARLHKHEVLDNKTRYALHGLILENPGLHYNEIIREFGLTNGVAAYHLHVLEREGFLRAVRDGTLKRFYSVTTKVPDDRRLTPDQIRDSIISLVARTPGINQREIVSELGIGRTVAGYHLKAMVDEGWLESSRFGKFTTYKVKPGRRLP